MDAVFIGGVPAKITIHDFRRYHAQSFPALTDAGYDSLLSAAIDTVYTMFPGVGLSMWRLSSAQTRFDKVRQCYLFLAAWYLTDRYPSLSTGSTSLNGVPLRRKKVDGVDLTFDTAAVYGDGSGIDTDPLSCLKSNYFGRMALFMIRTAPERALLRVEKVV